MMKRLKLLGIIFVVAATVCRGTAAEAAAISTEARDLLQRAVKAPDYPAAKAALAKLDEISPAGTAARLPERFSLEVKFGDQAAAERTLAALLTRAHTRKNPDGLTDAVHHAIRRTVPPACGITLLGAKRYQAREFRRKREEFVPLLVRAAEEALALAPKFGPCLATRSDVALLTGDLKLAAECTQKSLDGITRPAQQASTRKFLEELEKAIAQDGVK
jgi:hypothetical protein